MDVADWLRQLGLERYEATFRENDVSAGILPDLTAEDLKELGIVSVGHRRQLLRCYRRIAFRCEDGWRSDLSALTIARDMHPYMDRPPSVASSV